MEEAARDGRNVRGTGWLFDARSESKERVWHGSLWIPVDGSSVASMGPMRRYFAPVVLTCLTAGVAYYNLFSDTDRIVLMGVESMVGADPRRQGAQDG